MRLEIKLFTGPSLVFVYFVEYLNLYQLSLWSLHHITFWAFKELT